MANMNYCMFENTYADLQQCFEALGNKTFDELSESERKYAIKLVNLCTEISQDFQEEVNDLEN